MTVTDLYGKVFRLVNDFTFNFSFQVQVKTSPDDYRLNSQYAEILNMHYFTKKKIIYLNEIKISMHIFWTFFQII